MSSSHTVRGRFSSKPNAQSVERVRLVPQDGAGDETDPRWLLVNTTNAEVELWMATVRPLIDHALQDGRRGRVRSLFSPWERKFFESVCEQYTQRVTRGFDYQPLTGKQLFHLRALYVKVALLVEASLRAQETDR